MANKSGKRDTRGVIRRSGAPDEVALMDGVAAGRMDGFEALEHLRSDARLSTIPVIMMRPALAEEVLDDTMLVVWRKAHTYNPSAKVSTWIFGIAYRQALKALHRLDAGIDAGASVNEDALFDPSQRGPDGELQQQELHERLSRAMSALSAEHRAVIELTYYLGYSCRDVAQVMDCPVDTVKTRMFYARRRLKSLLGLSREEAI